MGPERSDGPVHVASVFERVRATWRPPTPEEEAARRLEEEDAHAARALADQRDTEDRWTQEGMPRRAWPHVVNPSETPALSVVKEWLASPLTILILTGLPDRGKTIAACWALAQKSGCFIKAIDIVRRGMFDTAWWSALYEAEILVLDDLGTEPLDEKGYALANVQALVDRAYDGRPRLIVTSNLALSVLSQKYLVSDGGRSLERVRECGQIVECVNSAGFRPSTLTPRRI